MPNIKSVIKDVKKSRERQKRNTAAKSAIKTVVKKARTAIIVDASTSSDAILKAVRLIDRVEDKGMIHRNTAARKKSRLMKQLNKATAASGGRTAKA